MPECWQNAARMLPECCQNAARMLPEWCQNAARMLPELWLPKGLRMCNCQQKQPRRLEPPAANEGDRATGRGLKVCNCKQKQAFEQKAAWWHCEKVNSFRARRPTTKKQVLETHTFIRGKCIFLKIYGYGYIEKLIFVRGKCIFIDVDGTWGRLLRPTTIIIR